MCTRNAVQSSHFFSSPCVTWSYFFVLCTELPLFLFSLCHMVVFLRVMYGPLPLFLFSLRRMIGLVHVRTRNAVQSSHFFSSPCVTWSYFFVVLCTELPLFLFSLCHMVVFLRVMYRAPTFSLLLVSHGRISSCYVQSSHFFSSPCVTWSYFFVLCTELPLFLFSLRRMIGSVHVRTRNALQSSHFFSSCTTWYNYSIR